MICLMPNNQRLKKVYAQLAHQRLDGLLVCLPANISYLTRSLSRDSYLVASLKGNIYITDSRYTEEAKACLKGIAVVKKYTGSLFKTIALTFTELGLKRVGFESRYLPFAEYQKIKDSLAQGIDLIPVHSIVESLRQIKEEDEASKIQAAARITLKALDFIRDFLLPGVKEIEVAAELERFIRYNGAAAHAFDIIVASGPNAAYPHHITSSRKLREGEMVLIDMGVDYSGYKSDLTRTFFLGKINVLARRVYNAVQEAQARAIRQIRPGVLSNKVDAAARSFLAEKGFDKYFGHNLGHGVGLEIHEAPAISPKDTAALEPGMVFTVEPGVYLPGKLGVRIEDMVRVTREGVEVLSGTID